MSGFGWIHCLSKQKVYTKEGKKRRSLVGPFPKDLMFSLLWLWSLLWRSLRIPGLGTSVCLRHGQEKEKKRRRKKKEEEGRKRRKEKRKEEAPRTQLRSQEAVAHLWGAP